MLLKIFYIVGGLAALINLLCLPAFYLSGEAAPFFVYIMAGATEVYIVCWAWREAFPKKKTAPTGSIFPRFDVDVPMPNNTNPPSL